MYAYILNIYITIIVLYDHIFRLYIFRPVIYTLNLEIYAIVYRDIGGIAHFRCRRCFSLVDQLLGLGRVLNLM